MFTDSRTAAESPRDVDAVDLARLQLSQARGGREREHGRTRPGPGAELDTGRGRNHLRRGGLIDLAERTDAASICRLRACGGPARPARVQGERVRRKREPAGDVSEAVGAAGGVRAVL